MPHKHTRRVRNDASNFDLPPSAVARPLPVGKAQNTDTTTKKSRRTKVVRGSDDTPRAFARLISIRNGEKRPADLDEGNSTQRKKRKRTDDNGITKPTALAPSAPATEQPKLRILSGESMSAFSVRVNQALPISGLTSKGKRVEGAPRDRQTRLEKKIQKKIATWRDEEARRNELEEDKRDLVDLEDAENTNAHEQEQDALAQETKKRKKSGGTGGKQDDDPWKVLKSAREAPKGIFDVAQAPPTFTRIPKEKFKVTNGARVNTGDIPRTAGSLRQREELGSARKSIIENYRKMMEAKRERISLKNMLRSSCYFNDSQLH